MQVSKDGVILHLSEHHGDGTPGSRAIVACEDVRLYHKELIDKKYKYNRPALQETDWDTLDVMVDDPFGNKLIFSQGR